MFVQHLQLPRTMLQFVKYSAIDYISFVTKIYLQLTVLCSWERNGQEARKISEEGKTGM